MTEVYYMESCESCIYYKHGFCEFWEAPEEEPCEIFLPQKEVLKE